MRPQGDPSSSRRTRRRSSPGPRAIALAAGGLLFAASVVFLLLVVAEGLWSLAQGDAPHRSLSARLFAESEPAPLPGDPIAASVSDRERFEELLAAFERDGVGLGNSPYRWLKNDRTRINHDVDGCRQQRPNLRKTVGQIRTHAFELFDPVTAFWDSGAQLSPEVRAFLDAHLFRETTLTINESGERITVPRSEAHDVVLIAGDSVAAGTGLDDDETLASQLQSRDPERRYVNLGINAAHAKDVVCALEKAAERHAGRIRSLVYVYCENDFTEDEPYATPEEVTRFLEEYVVANEIGDVTVVYAPYVYNVIPQITRFPGSRGDGFPHHGDEKRRLRESVAAAGFAWIDFTDIALEANREGGSQFSAFALFVDQLHHSREGVRRLADRLQGH